MAGDEQGRPPIPAELRRRVLVEAGHRCAIPTCRYIEVDVHHITPWTNCQNHEYENLIALCPNCHRRAGRGEIDRKSLHIYKANLRFAHDKFSQFEVDVLFEAYRAEGNFVPLPAYSRLLVKRLLDAEYIALSQDGTVARISGFQFTPEKVVITTKGRQFVATLEIESGTLY
jgi:hypothetical protein